MLEAVKSTLGTRASSAQGRRRSSTTILPPDLESSGIPLDRVPYFIPDLRRLGIIGGALVLIMLAASLAIFH